MTSLSEVNSNNGRAVNGLFLVGYMQGLVPVGMSKLLMIVNIDNKGGPRKQAVWKDNANMTINQSGPNNTGGNHDDREITPKKYMGQFVDCNDTKQKVVSVLW